MRRIAATIDSLNEYTGRVVIWLILAMVLIGAGNAVARYLTQYTDLNIGSNMYFELQWYLFSMVFLLGGAYALKHDSHVRVDVLFQRLPARARIWINIVGTALFLLPFTLAMLYFSWPAVRNSWAIREMSPDPGGLPRYPIKSVILVAFFLLFLQGVSELIKYVNQLRGDRNIASGSDDDTANRKGI